MRKERAIPTLSMATPSWAWQHLPVSPQRGRYDEALHPYTFACLLLINVGGGKVGGRINIAGPRHFLVTFSPVERNNIFHLPAL